MQKGHNAHDVFIFRDNHCQTEREYALTIGLKRYALK